MTGLLNPSNDFVFKRIFGSEENKDVLLAFLNLTFTEAGRPPLKEITLLNPYTDKDAPLDKQAIFDIWARTEAGEHINVEMQLFNKYDIEKRTLYYWGKRYSAQLQEGQTYKTLKKCVTINILNYSFLPNEHYHNTFHLKEDLTAIQLIDDIEIHFIELPKLDGLALPKHSGLINWLFFLKGTDKTNWEVLQMNEPTIKKAMSTLEFLSQDSEARIRYEERQKYLHDEASAMEWAMDNGVEKGLKKGQEQGEHRKALEIAKNLLKEGLAIDLISKATGLSEKEIMSLK
ncbi:putative transposase/invertase (TIGR01784 family) [Paenibacillus turicensis]|uniref:Transposase/invertase (TIGR01784 family) n=1 Tax=Paenibacillus turicensis TaxID=160487 RepID=A0ABS4FXI9_9BACL|nr:Rpn family recombination-promoting nuclease/putative transposase [Paenibacillus turicensis]MBP1907240.1 putative transposase/invertase (TIGR01784 family) [Paenibacillus turicensis]